MKTLACKDMGMNCDYVAQGNTEDEVMDQGMHHAQQDHAQYLADMRKTMSDDEMRDLTRSKIKDV